MAVNAHKNMFYTAWESKLREYASKIERQQKKITYPKKTEKKKYIWKTESTNRRMKIIIIF